MNDTRYSSIQAPLYLYIPIWFVSAEFNLCREECVRKIFAEQPMEELRLVSNSSIHTSDDANQIVVTIYVYTDKSYKNRFWLPWSDGVLLDSCFILWFFVNGKVRLEDHNTIDRIDWLLVTSLIGYFRCHSCPSLTNDRTSLVRSAAVHRDHFRCFLESGNRARQSRLWRSTCKKWSSHLDQWIETITLNGLISCKWSSFMQTVYTILAQLVLHTRGGTQLVGVNFLLELDRFRTLKTASGESRYCSLYLLLGIWYLVDITDA